jgi:phage gpG-like protein
MTTFTIEVKDEAVLAALKALSARVNNMIDVLDTIGTGIIANTQRRFETSTGPDGVKWKENSATTLAMLSERIGRSKSNRKKDGSLNARGSRTLAGKKPLVGKTGLLGITFHSLVVGNTLTVNSPFAYAAIQQFGGTTGAGSWIPGKTIPARPFLPIHQDGTLYPDDRAEILKAINDYLAQGLS